jgi:hypothetical protein
MKRTPVRIATKPQQIRSAMAGNLAGSTFQGGSMKYAFAVAALAAMIAAGPASAAMMACTGENMTKTSTMMMGMQDGAAKTGMGKEMGMANTEMSKGNMKGACMHYMKAQKMGMMKSDGMKGM